MRYIKAPLIILLAASLFQKLGQEVTLDRVTFHVSSSYPGPAQPPTSGWQPGGARLSTPSWSIFKCSWVLGKQGVYV